MDNEIQQLFLRYVWCRDIMDGIVSFRDKGDYGIAIDEDILAVRWRKYKALNLRQKDNLLDILGDEQ